MSRTFAKRGILGDEHRPRGPAARVTTLEDPALAAIASGTQDHAVSSVQPKQEYDCAELSAPTITEDDAGHASDMEVDELDETPPPPTTTTNSVMPAAGLASTIKTEDEASIRGVRRKFAETELSRSLDLNVEKDLAAKEFPELREALSQLYQVLDPVAPQEPDYVIRYATQLQVPILSVARWLAWRTTVNLGSSSSAKRRRVTPTNPLRPAEITSTSATPFNPSSMLGASAQGAVSQLSRPHVQEPSQLGSLSFSSNKQDIALISASGREPHLPRSHAESARPLPGPAGTAQEITLSGIAPSRRESLVSPTASVTSALFPSPASSPATAHARPLPPHGDGRRIPNPTRGPAPGQSGTWNPSQQSTPSLGSVQPQLRHLQPGQQRAASGGNGPHFPAHSPAGSMQPQYSPTVGQHGPSNVPRQQQPVQPACYGAPAQAPTRPTSQPLNAQQLSDNALYLQQVAQSVQGWQPPPPAPQQPMQPATQGLPTQQSAVHQASYLSSQVAGLGGPSYTSNVHGYTQQQMTDLLLAQQARQNQNPHPGQAAPPSRHTTPRSSVPTMPRPGERLVPNSYQPAIGIPTPPPPPQFSPSFTVRSISQHSQRSDGVGPQQQQGYAHAPAFRLDSQQGASQSALRPASGDYQQQQSASSAYGQETIPQHHQQLALQQHRSSNQYNPANAQASYAHQPPPADQPPPLGSSLHPNQYQRHQPPVSTAPGPGAYVNAQGPSQQPQYRPSVHPNQQPPPSGPSAGYNQQLHGAHSNPGQQYASGNLVPEQRFAGAMTGGAQYPRNMARASQPANGVPLQGHGMRPPSAPRPPSQPQVGQPGYAPGWTPPHDWSSGASQPQSQPYQRHGAHAPSASGCPQNQPSQPFQDQYAQPQQLAHQHSVSSHSVPPPGVPPTLANAFNPSGPSQVAQHQQQMAVPDSGMQAARPVAQQYTVPRIQPAPPAQRRQSHPLPAQRLAGPALALQLESQAGSQAEAGQSRVPTPTSASQLALEHAGAAGPAAQLGSQLAPAVESAATPPHVCWRTHAFLPHCAFATQFRGLTDPEYEQLTSEEFTKYARWVHRYWGQWQDIHTRNGDAVRARKALGVREREEIRARARKQREHAAAQVAQWQQAGQFSAALPTPSPTHRFEELPSPPRTATSPLPAADEVEQPAVSHESPAAALPEPATMLYAFFDLAARGPLDASVVPPAFAELDNTTESVAVEWLMPYFNAWMKLRSPDAAMRANVRVNMVQYLKQSGAFPRGKVKLQLRTPQPQPASAGDTQADVEMMTPVQKVEELDEGEEDGAGTTSIGIATPDPTPEPHQRLEESPPPPPPPPPRAAAAAADWRAGLFAKINAM